jgi:hypothetical protein
VYFEPEDPDDVLRGQVERFDVGALEMKAKTLRDIPHEKGRWPLKWSVTS